jgi:LmbE family N-acetylglucosaminyl deacetylase
VSKVLILSPHCDDIPLSLGASLLAREWGDDVRGVVIFSESRYSLKNGWNNDVAAQTAVRNGEERRAAELADYRLEFLGFPEPGVRPGYGEITAIFNPDLPFEPDPIWQPLRERLLGLLREEDGMVISPLGVGHHIDHRMVAACFREAADTSSRFTPVFYEDLPYAARFSSRDIRKLVPVQLGGRALEPRVLNKGRLADKMQLLSVYESQLSEDDYGSVADHWACRGCGELTWWPEGEG